MSTLNPQSFRVNSAKVPPDRLFHMMSGSSSNPFTPETFGSSGQKPSGPIKTRAFIICVDDDPQITKSIKRAIDSAIDKSRFELVTFNDSPKALEYYRSVAENCVLVITDRQMPEMDGLALLNEIKKVNPNTPVLVISGGISNFETDQFIHAGAFKVIPKPFVVADLISTVSGILGAKPSA